MALSSVALIDLTQAKNFLRIDAAASLRVDAEYVGMGNGTVRIFTLAHTPIGGSLRLFVAGVLQVEPTHYTISGATVTFVTAPALNQPVTVSYDRAAPANTFEVFDDAQLETLIEAATKKTEDYTGRAFVQRSITEVHQGNGTKGLRLYRRPIISVTSVAYLQLVRRTGDGTIRTFSLGHIPRAGSLTVHVNGVLQTSPTHFTLSGQVVTFITAPVSRAEIIFRFEVSLVLGQDYFEQLHIGRLVGGWLREYEYIASYTAGYGTTRPLTQDAVPDAVAAVLITVANWWENRLGVTDQNITGIGSISYAGLGLPEAAKNLLGPLRTEFL